MIFSKKIKVLVTAGPTWVPIDSVRVMTSIFTGETGLFIARHLHNCGAKVDLLMGPGRAKISQEDQTNLMIQHFFYYDELDDLLCQQLKLVDYDIIIHSSAVADYTSKNSLEGKISSQQSSLQINLVPTQKIIDKIRHLAPKSFLVKFKLQVGLSEQQLLNIAHKSLLDSQANLIIANDLKQMNATQHIAYIIEPDSTHTRTNNKQQLCEALANKLQQFS